MKYAKIKGGRKLSSFIEPMAAQPTDRPAFDSPDWIFEIKWDGFRAIAEINKKGNRLYSRNGLTFDAAYPRVFEELKAIKKNAIVDGEIVVLDEQGKPSFQKLQNYKNTDRYVIQYYVFDVIEIDGKSVVSLPLVERKEKLKKIIGGSDIVKFCDHLEGEGKLLFKEMAKLGWEGMIAKRKASSYQIGKRSPDWLKIKNVQTTEAIIVGFTEPKSSRKFFGSILLAAYKGGQLISIGKVGTGFTDRSLKELHEKLLKIVRKNSPLNVPIKDIADVTWVAPKLVCDISFTEITDDGSIRHPSYRGLRIDKTPDQVKL